MTTCYYRGCHGHGTRCYYYRIHSLLYNYSNIFIHFFFLGSAVIPIQFHANREGQYECHILLKSGYDLRTIVVEATITTEERLMQIEFKTQAIQSLTQNIPVVSQSIISSHFLSQYITRTLEMRVNKL